MSKAELSCCLCGEECWTNTASPDMDLLMRIADARDWVRRYDLDARFGPEPWYECTGCQRRRAAMLAAQD